MSKILITGATGFIGRALSKALKNQGYDLILMRSANGDIARLDTFDQYRDADISHVFHLAGKTYVPDSWSNPQAFYQTNVLGTTSVLEFCKSRRVPLTFVSAYIYGHPEILPIKEDSRIQPSNPYALSKRLAEQACEFYSHTHDLPISVIRPFNVYGLGQDEKFLIPSIIRQALTGEKIVLQDLEPKRDYVFLDDLVEALTATLVPSDGYKVFNIGSGSSLSVKEAVDIIQDVAKTKKEVVSEKKVRSNELMDVVADISKAQKILGWYPRYTFRQGIERMIVFENGER